MATLLGTLGVKLTANTQQFVRAMDGVSKTMKKHEKGFQTVAAGTGILAAGLTGLGVKATMVGVSFDKAMTRVGAITNATENDLKSLETQALKWSEQTIFSAQQVAEGMNFMAMAGNSVNDIMGNMKSVLNLATVGAIDLGSAADVVTNIMKGFGQNNEELSASVDVLANAITTANVDVLQMGQTFKFVGPVAKAAGVEFKEVAAMTALLGNAGIQGTLAGTTLKNAIAKLIAPTKKTSDVLKDLGINVMNAQGGLRPMVTVLDEIAKAGATPTEVLEIFGIRAGPGMLALLDLGTDALVKYRGGLDKVGTAAIINDRVMASFSGRVEQLKSKFGVFLIQIQKSLVPILNVMNTVLAKSLDAFSAMPKPMRDFVVVGGFVTATVAGMTAAFIALGLAMPNIKLGFAAITIMIKALAVKLAPIGAFLLPLITKGFLILKAAMIPLLATFAAVAAAAGAMFLLFDGYVELLKFYGVDINNFGKNLRAMFASLGTSVKDVLSRFGDAAGIMWKKITVIWTKGTSTFITWFESNFPRILETIKNVLATAKGMFHTAFDPFIVAFDFYFGKGAGLRDTGKPKSGTQLPEGEDFPLPDLIQITDKKRSDAEKEAAQVHADLVKEKMAERRAALIKDFNKRKSLEASTMKITVDGYRDLQKIIKDGNKKLAEPFKGKAKLSFQGGDLPKIDPAVAAFNKEMEEKAKEMAKLTATGMRKAAFTFGAQFEEGMIDIASFTLSKIGTAFGTFGEVLNGAIEGFKQGGPIGAIIGAIAVVLSKSKAFQKSMTIFSGLMGMLVKAFEPLARNIVALLMSGLPIILLFTQIVGGLLRALKPATDLLNFVTKVLLKFINLVGRGYNFLIEKMADFLNFIHADSAAKKLRKAKFKTISLDIALDEALPMDLDNTSDSLNNLADTAKTVAESLLNVPEGFRAGLRRFESTAFDTGTQLSTALGVPGNSGPAINIQIDSTDPQETWDLIKGLAENDRYQLNGSTAGISAAPFSVPGDGA